MNKKTIFLVISVLLIIIASGCTKRQCVEADYPTFQAILDLPANGSTVGYGDDITFDWHHNEPCEPHRYILYMRDTVQDHTAHTISDIGATELTSNLESILILNKLTPYPGREYQWWVVPTSWEKTEESLYGPESQKFTFTYGEICSPGELVPPELAEPEDGSWANSTNQPPEVNISWSNMGDCLPEEYHYEVALDPDFNQIVHTGNQISKWWGGFIPVQDCSHLYWRVQSVAGNSSSVWSETFSFFYEGENPCWFAESGDVDAIGATIKGYVFEDKCPGSLPFESESVTPPQGCVSSQYGIHADGIWDNVTNSEPGIPDIGVFWGDGPCPVSALDMSITDENGMYYFQVQAPGEYCVFISKSESPELENGLFTLPWPATDYYLAQQTITVSPNDIAEQNFGWDRDEIAKLNFKVKVLSTCRLTDNKNSAAVMYLEEGSVIPVVATNEEKTWFLTRFDCFVSIATGEAEEGDLPLYPEQPIPVVDGQGDPDPTGSGESDPGVKPCSSYTSGPRGCPSPRCVWIYPIAGPSYCTESD